MSAEQQKKPSKISDSLLKTIEGSNKKASNTETDSAFAEADNSLSKSFEDGADSIEQPEVVEEPELVIPRPTKKTSGKAPTILSIIALLIGVVSLGITGYSFNSQESFKVTIAENVGAFEENVGELTSRADGFAGELATIKSELKEVDGKTAEIEILRSEVIELKSSIAEMKVAVDELSEGVANQSSVIEEHGGSIQALKKDMKAMKDRHAVKKAPKKAAVKKKVDDPTKIEGATVASIDLWGTEPYVVLRDENGGWVPLTMGDHYRGWRFAGATEHGAMFKRGGKKKTLQVEE